MCQLHYFSLKVLHLKHVATLPQNSIKVVTFREFLCEKMKPLLKKTM